jgi:hypothetical protein
MGRLEEIEKYWPVLFPDEQRDTFLRDAVLIANRDIRFLLSEVHRLRAAIEQAYKGCNHRPTIKILRDALNEEEK